MNNSIPLNPPHTESEFSLKIYLLVVFALSYPFQIAYYFLGETYKPILLVSMMMAGVGTFICGKYIFKDGFKGAGWNWGKPKYYFYSALLAFFLWLLPSLIERHFGFYVPLKSAALDTAIFGFLSSFLLTILPAFGEEFSWRGYLLPRLFQKYSPRKALVLHGFITWLWHLPFVVIMGLEYGNGSIFSVAFILVISVIPTTLHAVVFAYVWYRSNSLAVSTFYHVAFDEVRDALTASVGLGFLGQNWQMLALTLLGVLILQKVRWKIELKKENVNLSKPIIE